MTDPFDLLHDELVAAAARTREPARRRVWWSRRPSHPIAVAVALLALGGSAAAAAVTFTSKPSAALVGRVPGHTGAGAKGRAQLEAVAGDTYRITVAPTLQAGTAGLCDIITYSAVPGGRGGGGGECGGPYPTSSQPLFGDSVAHGYRGNRIPAGGVIASVFTGPSVWAVRVGDRMTVRTRTQPGLPAGDRAAVFYLPAGSPEIAALGMAARVQASKAGAKPLTLTPLDREGRAIPTAPQARSAPFRLPARFWQQPEVQPRGSCGLSAPSSFKALWGTIVARIRPYPGVQGPALVSCLSIRYRVANTKTTIAVLLNARSPGSPPPAIFGATPVPGYPGYVNRNYPTQLLEPITARRDGHAWLIAQGGQSLARRIDVLRQLRITNIDLSGGG